MSEWPSRTSATSGYGNTQGRTRRIRRKAAQRSAPRRLDINMTKAINSTRRPEETTPPSLDPVVLSMIGGVRRSTRLIKRAQGLVKRWQSLAIVLQTHPHRGVSSHSHRSTDRTGVHGRFETLRRGGPDRIGPVPARRTPRTFDLRCSEGFTYHSSLCPAVASMGYWPSRLMYPGATTQESEPVRQATKGKGSP